MSKSLMKENKERRIKLLEQLKEIREHDQNAEHLLLYEILTYIQNNPKTAKEIEAHFEGRITKHELAGLLPVLFTYHSRYFRVFNEDMRKGAKVATKQKKRYFVEIDEEGNILSTDPMVTFGAKTYEFIPPKKK